MAEFTQEQIDKMIEDKVNEARKGLFSEEELNKRIMSETDRRVESGIQKGLETNKLKWESEYSERAKLSADELAKKDYDEKLKDVSVREQNIKKRANNLEARDMLTDAQIPKSQYDKLMTMLVSDDVDVTKANVQNYIDSYTTSKTEIETRIKGEFSKIPSPKLGDPNTVISATEFKKMSYGERAKFKLTNPEQYKEFLK